MTSKRGTDALDLLAGAEPTGNGLNSDLLNCYRSVTELVTRRFASQEAKT
jgi:hypothetical protein